MKVTAIQPGAGPPEVKSGRAFKRKDEQERDRILGMRWEKETQVGDRQYAGGGWGGSGRYKLLGVRLQGFIL